MLTRRLLQLRKTFSIKQTLKKRLAEFITVDTGGVLRTAPTTKERRYKNIEIAEDFKKIDTKRKMERLENMRKREYLLEKKINEETKLLSSSETAILEQQLQDVKKMLQESNQEIQALTELIDQNEAEFMLVQGFFKITVLNHIKHLHYLHTHNPGYTLHPETIKAIENIHYCVNHNLPVNRITLYEIMPEFFQTQIGELEESVRKLIAEKQILIEDPNSTSSIRFFYKLGLEENNYDISGGSLTTELQHVHENVTTACNILLAKHGEYLEKVAKGQTPFRGLDHLTYVMLSDLKIKYLPEQQALREDILAVAQIKKQWDNYKAEMIQTINDVQYNYVQPPPYIANHPVLMNQWQKLMVSYTNPIDIQDTNYLPEGDMTEVKLGEQLRQRISQVVRQKYDPLFVEEMSGDRSKIDKKKQQLEFYKLSTNVFEQLKALEAQDPEEQIFEKLPRAPNKFQITQRKKNLIKIDHLTRMIFLSNTNKQKYSLAFFSEWTGVDKEELRTLLKSVSYLRVPLQAKNQHKGDLEYQILKFQM